MWKFAGSVIVCLFVVAVRTATSEDDPKKAFAPWLEYYKEIAAGYDVRLKSVPDEPLKVSAEPVLVYSNPTIGLDTHGALFVWTRDGRAEAIGAIWSKRIDGNPNSRKNVNHEFHSLATEPLVAEGKDGVTWTPETPGVIFRPVPNAPPPADSRTRRLAQMREISRQFSGFDLNPREGGGEEVERQMRILPAPIYRYAERMPSDGKTEPTISDGAIFGLFYDWDPEVFLVLETRPTAEGPRWHYGVAYLDYKPLRLQHKGVDVWEKAKKNFGSAKSKYYCVIGVTTKPVELK